MAGEGSLAYWLDGSGIPVIPNQSMPSSIEILAESALSSGDHPSPTYITDEEEVNEKGKRRSNKSVVWKFFKKRVVQGKVVAQCIRCQKQLTAKSGIGTSHLLKHSKKCFGIRLRQDDLHQEVLRKNHANAQVSDNSFDPRSTKMAVTHEKKKMRSNKSVVWTFFEKRVVQGKVVAQCIRCKKQLTAKSGIGTSHLLKHSKNCFGYQLSQDNTNQVALRNTNPNAQVPNQVALRNTNANAHVSNDTFDPQLAREALAKMIISHEYPLRIVEHIGFRNFSASLQPLFKVPSRSTVKGDIFKMYESEKVKIKELLDMNNSRVAITTNTWTVGYKKDSYMSVTAHFIDRSWNLQNHILRFIHVPAMHTSSGLSADLYECLMEWNIENKIAGITLDNGFTSDAVIAHLLGKLDKNKMMRNGCLLNIRCCAHVLNLIVKDGFDVIKDEIELIRESVMFWTVTPERVEEFKETARELSIPITEKLSLDCPSRWNSTIVMVKVALMYKDVFSRLREVDASYTSLPNEAQWQITEEICERLSLLSDTMESFSRADHVTANLYFPKFCEIKLALENWSHSLNEVIQTMACNMLGKFNAYWDVVRDVMCVAVVLDPRYKMNVIEYYFPQVYGENADSQIEHIRKLCYDLVSDYQSHSLNESGLGGDSDVENETSPSLSGFDSFVRKKKRFKFSAANSELDHYLDEFVIPRTKKFDILQWWKMDALKYPVLQAIVRDFLCIPVSTVTSQCAFRTESRVVSAHRSRLHHDTLEALVCLRNWLHTTESGECSNLAEYASVIDDIDNDSDTSDTDMGCADLTGFDSRCP